MRTNAAHPAVTAHTFVDYNCGSVESSSGAWSYFCGELPIVRRYDLSPDIPDSENEVLQNLLVFAWPALGGKIESRTSFYRGTADSYRDFDVSSLGETYGVCTDGVNCTGPPDIPRIVDRLVSVNEVSRALSTVREWTQEVRWQSNGDDRWQSMFGAAAWWTDSDDEARLGVARGGLSDVQNLTAVVPVAPFTVGPLSLVNAAMVENPNAEQRTQHLDRSKRRTVALFGAVDYALTPRTRARAELRATWERRKTNNVTASFAPGFGDAIGPLDFSDVTPRLSVQYLPSDRWSSYLSAAKGSQSGGINPVPGLSPHEQGYDPEYNWTYELGLRFRNADRTFGTRTTLYYVDWQDTQMLGFPDTPGIANLITRNTRGIYTSGLEFSLQAKLTSMLRTELDYSWTDAAFRAGSDDPGSRRFCGIGSSNASSTFCTVGPARSGDVAGLLIVPYIDGNVPARVPRHMWHAALIAEPSVLPRGGRMVFRLDANGQDNVFDRAINGASFGSRTLLDARLTFVFGDWSIGLWGSNLGDTGYVRALASRGQIFFPTTPRPLDSIYGDGRRIGLSVSFERS
jgi:outer membrane receptor protein involved in Fe transport